MMHRKLSQNWAPKFIDIMLMLPVHPDSNDAIVSMPRRAWQSQGPSMVHLTRTGAGSIDIPVNSDTPEGAFDDWQIS